MVADNSSENSLNWSNSINTTFSASLIRVLASQEYTPTHRSTLDFETTPNWMLTKTLLVSYSFSKTHRYNVKVRRKEDHRFDGESRITNLPFPSFPCTTATKSSSNRLQNQSQEHLKQNTLIQSLLALSVKMVPYKTFAEQ